MELWTVRHSMIRRLIGLNWPRLLIQVLQSLGRFEALYLPSSLVSLYGSKNFRFLVIPQISSSSIIDVKYHLRC